MPCISSDGFGGFYIWDPHETATLERWSRRSKEPVIDEHRKPYGEKDDHERRWGQSEDLRRTWSVAQAETGLSSSPREERYVSRDGGVIEVLRAIKYINVDSGDYQKGCDSHHEYHKKPDSKVETATAD